MDDLKKLGGPSDRGDVNDSEDIFELLVNDYNDKRANADTFQGKINADKEFLMKVDSYGLNYIDIFKPNDTDKMYFVVLVFLIQMIAFTIVEQLIEYNIIDSLLYIVIIYAGIYVGLMGGLTFIVNTMGYKLKLILNYLNIEYNFWNIFLHFGVIFLFVFMIMIVSLKVKTFEVDDNDEEDKIKLLYRIDMISTIITIFAGLFVFLL